MKKTLLIALVLVTALLCAACGPQKSALEKATGLPAAQTSTIEALITAVGVSIDSATAADLSTIETGSPMDASYKGYQLKDKAGSLYFLILHEAEVIALINMQTGEYLYGSTTMNG